MPFFILNEKKQSNLNPFIIRQSWPNMVRLRDSGLVRLQDNLGSVIVHVQGSQDQDQPKQYLCSIFFNDT